MTIPDEQKLIKAMQVTKTTVEHTTMGTIASVQNSNGHLLAQHMAVLNPKDISCHLVGAAISLGRCYMALGIELERLGHKLDEEQSR